MLHRHCCRVESSAGRTCAGSSSARSVRAGRSGPDVNPAEKELFEKEQDDLLDQLHTIPTRLCHRKINELVKRVRALRTHLLLVQHLKQQMPALLFKQSTQAKLLEGMSEQFTMVRSSETGVFLCGTCHC
jgi:beta-glucosidase-like glycosyl hydrolase